MSNDNSGQPMWLPQQPPDGAADPYAPAPSASPAAAAPQAPFAAPDPHAQPAPTAYQGQAPYSGAGGFPGSSGYPGSAQYPAPGAYPGPGQYPRQPGYPSYGPAGYGQPPAPRQSPVLAIVGLVLAILAAPIGLIISIIARVQARRTGVGRGLATAGIVVGCLWIAAAVAIPVALNQRLGGSEGEGAREAFSQMQNSLIDADCDAYMASTTEDFRTLITMTTCEQFDMVMELAGPGTFGWVPVTDVDVDGDEATLWTVERVPDAAGGETVERVEYRVIREGDVWLVDWIDLS